jgi:hypothetical protein
LIDPDLRAEPLGGGPWLFEHLSYEEETNGIRRRRIPDAEHRFDKADEQKSMPADWIGPMDFGSN